jgi:predicted ABC-type transport system involved in lysophospholipase L1 biosynthesis ATPase subunit
LEEQVWDLRHRGTVVQSLRLLDSIKQVENIKFPKALGLSSKRDYLRALSGPEKGGDTILFCFFRTAGSK